jgi:hypothetical protein
MSEEEKQKQIAELEDNLGFIKARLNAETETMEHVKARFDDECSRFNAAILDLEKSRNKIEARLATLGVKPKKGKKGKKEDPVTIPKVEEEVDPIVETDDPSQEDPPVLRARGTGAILLPVKDGEASTAGADEPSRDPKDPHGALRAKIKKVLGDVDEATVEKVLQQQLKI